MTTNTKGDGPGVAGIAAGALAAVAAAGATYYFFLDEKAGRHRKAAAKWADGFKDEVVKRAKELKEFDEAVVHGIVDRVAAAYEGAASVDTDELREAADELKRNWRMVVKEIRDAGGYAKKGARKAAKKGAAAGKRIVKKAVKRARG